MSQPPITVRLDPRRLDQLKALGSALNLSNAGVIASMIKEKIAAGVIPADIPGIMIANNDEGISVSVDGSAPRAFSRSAAQSFATTIRAVIDGTETPTLINMDHGYAVQKQGTGVKISMPFGSKAYKFPPDLALDLADLVEKAAA